MTTVTISLNAARQLPGLLGRIAPAMLREHGIYVASVNGIVTRYVLTERDALRRAVALDLNAGEN